MATTHGQLANGVSAGSAWCAVFDAIFLDDGDLIGIEFTARTDCQYLVDVLVTKKESSRCETVLH